MVFFSIILNTYNRASFLPKAINSVISQLYKEFELIIVDDGSTDNTAEIIGTYNDNRIKYFFIQNSERGFARNFGIKKAEGKYIAFLDSDDYFKENHLSAAFFFIEQNNNPVIFFQRYYYLHSRSRKYFEVHFPKSKIIESLSQSNILFPT